MGTNVMGTLSMKFRDGIFGLTLTSALALAAFSANAADMYRGEPAGGYKDGPVYVANTWTGFYVGASVGAAWGTDDIVDKNNLNGGAHYSIEDTSVITIHEAHSRKD